MVGDLVQASTSLEAVYVLHEHIMYFLRLFTHPLLKGSSPPPINLWPPLRSSHLIKLDSQLRTRH